mmetsp:Transcript_32335/g.23876  ORF Transcript_32335/g.23876 Transcript_32335/m.23876 type:complete len:166 (+) Transcript_32335:1672-2169(+)
MMFEDDEVNYIPFEHTEFSDDNLKSMAMLIILFERKNELISLIKELNDQYQRNCPYTEEFRQKYIWAQILLQATEQAIDPVITMFRFRKIRAEFLPLYCEGQQVNDPGYLAQCRPLFGQEEPILKHFAPAAHLPPFVEEAREDAPVVSEVASALIRLVEQLRDYY